MFVRHKCLKNVRFLIKISVNKGGSHQEYPIFLGIRDRVLGVHTKLTFISVTSTKDYQYQCVLITFTLPTLLKAKRLLTQKNNTTHSFVGGHRFKSL